MVLIIAKISNALESLNEKIWVMIIVIATKIASVTTENKPVADDIIKNQKENPTATTRALNLGDDSSILDRINECHETALC